MSGCNKRSDRTLKILTVVIMAHDMHSEYRPSWNVYDISINLEFLNEMYGKSELNYTEIVQKIFKYKDIQYTISTLYKKLNCLVYRMLFYVNIYGSYKLLKTVRFLAHPIYFLLLVYCY